MKDYSVKFKYNDTELPAVFNLNVMEEIQEEYGTIKKWGELTDAKSGEVNAKALIFGLRAMINEAREIESEKTGEEFKPFTLKQVGRIITDLGLQESAVVLNNAVVEATKSENTKNA